jgi:hypothetical protein
MQRLASDGFLAGLLDLTKVDLNIHSFGRQACSVID